MADRAPSPSSGVRIRAAVPADADAIAAVHRESRRVAMPYLPPPRRSHEEVTRWVRDVVLPACRTVVAVRGTEVLGYAAVEGDLLDQLYLRPDVRRAGLGTRLLAEARRLSPGGLTLHVFRRNTAARAFYARHGFRVVATGDGSGNMEGLPELTLRWTPGPEPEPGPGTLPGTP
ncbi:hypothetical protein ADL22_30110 [Streptomyces sp. NRRL F-4489]|uniref:GNAT family N-acetyltransferase n=1 Tax=Streptomyces sp. NRRL F-4489 TaxID=1609095 RepID=UPI000747BD4A|nr:GNAT family N-acetyltransferase [Streptomyces sp. NRRL F-4489]KUL34680.1 hypothetical protein ADL22_30110 [Streptomyces sp. NRRL F-4489]